MTKESDRRRSAHRQKILKRYKLLKGCRECGYRKHSVALDFNHIDPTLKGWNLGDSTKLHKVSWQRLKDEVNKCEILCANCHRIHTLGRA